MAKKINKANRMSPILASGIKTSIGVTGCETIRALKNNSCVNIPKAGGIFLVLKTNNNRPVFLATGTGGFYNNINPNEPIPTLKNKWVKGTNVLYIGKSTNLKQRIHKFVRFGQGCNTIDACGGRYIWQLKDSDLLHICWIPLPNIILSAITLAKLKRWLLEEFEYIYESLPFANLHY